MSTNDWQQRWQQAAKAESTVPVTTPPTQTTQEASTLDSFDLLTARRLAFLLWRMARESGIDGYHIQEEAHDANR